MTARQPQEVFPGRVTRPAMEIWLRAAAAEAARLPAAAGATVERLTDLGLDSLAAVELQHRLYCDHALEVPLEDLLVGPTFAALAARLLEAAAARGAPAAGLTEASATSAAPSTAPATSAAPAAPADGAPGELSHGQQALWFVDRWEPESGLYNVAAAARVLGPLDRQALRRALLASIERHAALRTRFADRDGGPRQWTAAAQLDYREEPAADAVPGGLQAQLVREAYGPFDLEHAAPVRFRLFERPGQEPVILLVAHHLVCDFWSLGVLLADLSALYARETGGTPASRALPPAPAWSHADYVRWQRDLLTPERLASLGDAWRARRAGAPPALDLATDRPRAAGRGRRGAVRRLSLPRSLGASLAAVARQHGVTLFTVLLAAFQTLLQRHSGQDEVVVGTPTAGRSRPEWARVVGYFVNPLPLRGRPGAAPSFARLLADLHGELLHAMAHQEMPFPLLAERLQPVRDPLRTPVFQVLLALQQAPAGLAEALPAFALGEPAARLDLGGLALAPLPLAERRWRFELTLSAALLGPDLVATLDYAADLFDAVTAERLSARLAVLLASVAADASAPVAGLPLSSAAERHQLLHEWGEGGTEAAAARPVHEIFLAQARRTPRAPAVHAGGRSLAYGELAARSLALAGRVRRLGVGPEVVVGLFCERSPELVVGLLAILAAGGAYLPIDPACPLERLGWLLADAGAALAVTDAVLAPRLEACGIPVPRRVVVERDGEAAGQQEAAGHDDEAAGQEEPVGQEAVAGQEDEAARREDLAGQKDATGQKDPAGQKDAAGQAAAPRSSLAAAPAAGPGNLAYLIYTSGSTGDPKGVAVEHRQLSGYLAGVGERLGLAACASFASVSTIAADLGNTMVFAALASGGCLHLIDADCAADAEALAEYCRGHAVECLKIVPSHLAALCAAAPPIWLPPLLVLGGEASTREEVQALARAAPRCRIFNHYGPTETTVGVLTARAAEPSAGGNPPAGVLPAGADIATARGGAPGDTLGDWALPADASPLPLGRPLPGRQVYVLDAAGQPLPAGAPGEIHLGGGGLARGYLHAPAATAERFLPHPWAARPGERLYRTGDRGRFLADGQVEFLGRLDDQIKVRGFRVEPAEIAAALGRHPAVAAALVTERRDAAGRRRLAAYFVAAPAAGPAPDAGALRAFLRRWLPDPMVPAAFVALAALPRTANGKIDRARLPEPLWEPAGGAGGEGKAAGGGPAEQLLAAIWADVLGLAGAPSPADDFFAAGGHSLLATQLVSRLRRAVGVDLPLRAVFETPVLGALAARIEAARGAGIRPLLPPIEPRPPGRSAPLSFAQERLWLIERYAPGSATYNLLYFARLHGSLRPAALAAAWRAVVRRHEVLRSRFAEEAGRPVQCADGPPPPLRLAAIDLAALAPAARRSEAERLMDAEGRRPFDLRRGPLHRAALVRLDDASHLFLLCLHHIVSDAWSRGVLAGELAALYAAAAAGLPSPLPPLPPLAIQYADFAVWQRAWLRGEAQERLRAAWRERLGTGAYALELPADRPPRAPRSGRGGIRFFSVGAALAAALAGLARRQGATLFMVLLAAFDVLLHRCGGQDDVRVGTPIAGRNRQELEPLIGFFVNTLVLRADLAGDPPLARLLGQLRAVTLDAYALQDLPFQQLVEDAEGDGVALQAVLVLQNTPLPELRFGDLRLEPMERHNGTAKFDLVLTLTAGAADAGAMAGSLQFASDLFDAATAERLVEQFTTLLAAIAAAPQRPLSALELLPAAARHRLLVEAQAPPMADAGAPVVALFSACAAARPTLPALIWDDAGGGESSWSYAARASARDRLAGRLRMRGVGAGGRIAICLRHSPALVTAVLAVLKTGAAYVPLDPAHPRRRMALVGEDAGVALWLCDAATAPLLPAPAAARLDLDAAWEGAARADGSPLPPVPAESLAYVIYTSGSTGVPKGVGISHRSLAAYCRWAAAAYLREPGSTVALHSSLSFDLTVTSLFPPLAGGHCVRIFAGRDRQPVIEEVFRDRRVEVVKLTPSHLSLVASGDRRGSRIRRLVVGGEALEWSLAERAAASFGGAVEILNEYGPTEATVGCMIQRFDADAGAGIARRAAVPIGRAAAGATVLVLDRHLAPVPENATGEIHIGGPGLAQLYLGRPELTAERFVPHPWAVGERLYRSGDRARVLSDGSLEFLGRGDAQVKFHGFRVELEEVSGALKEHREIRDSVVRLLCGEDGQQVMVAYYVSRRELDAAALRQWLVERLPAETVPNLFVHLRRLPLTLNGKVDLRELPGLGEARRRLGGAGSGAEAPSTPTEELLCGIWMQVLRVARVGVRDSFFALGGHSLLGAEVIARVRERLGVELPLRALFEHPTVAALAGQVDRIARGARSIGGVVLPRIERAPRGGPLPLSFAQQRLWFLDQMAAGSPLYNVAAALLLRGALDVPALAAALREIVRRHEVLRTGYCASPGGPRQHILPPARLPLPEVDLGALPPERRRRELESLARAEARRPFALERGAPLRAVLVRLEVRGQALLLTVHHIAADGGAVEVLLRELSALYAAAAARLPSPLAEPRLQYADFAVWQRRHMQGPMLERHLAYWRRQLADRPAAPVLPADLPPPASRSRRGATHRFTVPPAVTGAVRDLARRHGATLFVTLLAAYQTLLHRYSGEDVIPIGSPISARRGSETAEMIGPLLNTAVLASDLGGNPAFGELLGRVREVVLGAHAHQDLPFEMVVDELQPERDAAAAPLFQVWFHLHEDPLAAGAPGGLGGLGGLGAERLPVESGLSQFDLILGVMDRGGDLAASFTYATDLFRREVVAEMSVHLVTLLAAVAADERLSLLQIPLADAAAAAGSAALPAPRPGVEDSFAF